MSLKNQIDAEDDRKYPRLALSRREAAKLLNIHVNSLDRLVRRGLIRPSRALRKPLFTRDELERFLVDTV